MKETALVLFVLMGVLELLIAFAVIHDMYSKLNSDKFIGWLVVLHQVLVGGCLLFAANCLA